MSSYRSIAVCPSSADFSVYVDRGNFDMWHDDCNWSYADWYASRPDCDTSSLAGAGDRLLYSALSATGYFSVTSGEDKDISSLKEEGVAAVARGKIGSVCIEEIPRERERTGWRSVTREDGTEERVRVVLGYDLFLDQSISVTYSYEIRDIDTGSLIASQTLQDHAERTTRMESREFSDLHGEWEYVSTRWCAGSWSPAVEGAVTSMLSGFADEIAKHLAPSRARTRVHYLKNKPKNPGWDAGWKAAKAEDWETAYEIWYRLWTEEGHVPSGCDAAIMLARMGRYDEAADLARSALAKDPDNGKAAEIFARLESIRSAESEAQDQLGKEEET